jgi:P-type Cu2+ transporter
VRSPEISSTLKEGCYYFLLLRCGILQTVSPSPKITPDNLGADNLGATAVPATAQHDVVQTVVQTVAIDITGMKCAGCVRAVENALSACDGVVSATVNLATEVATVRYEQQTINPDQLAETLTHAGFPAQPRTTLSSASDTELAWDIQTRRQQEKRQQLRQLAIALLLLVFSTLGHLQQLTSLTLPGFDNIWFHCGLATLALAFPGRTMIIDGWRGLQRNAPNMNTLVSLGTLTAFLTSLVALLLPQLGWECFFDEPVMLVSFILLGRTLEQQARHRAASAFQSLLTLRPKTARLIPQSSQPSAFSLQPSTHSVSNSVAPAALPPSAPYPLPSIDIPAEAVRVGEWLQVLPGDQVPVDGEIVAGVTTVDESMLTGESIPVTKQPGDRLSAGTINQSGVIALRATRTGKDTTIAQIIDLIETAQTGKAPIQKLADTVAGYFTYGVIAIALLTFLFWYLIGTSLWGLDAASVVTAHHHSTALMAPATTNHEHSILNHLFTHHPVPSPANHSFAPLLLSLKLAIAVLVVACPCALGLATPTAILVGSGIGAERGLLIRGGEVLEKVHSIDTIVLDKTGTLTTGTPTVADCLLLNTTPQGISLSAALCPLPSALLQLAATVESGTRHPLAIAIQNAAQAQHLALLPAQDFVTVPGSGVSAQVQLVAESDSALHLVVLGTAAWLTENQIPIDQAILDQADDFAQAGKTVVYVALAGVVVGLIAVRDELRADAVTTVQRLQQMGLKVMLLTGDRKSTALAIAQTLNIPAQNVLAEVRPEGKAQVIAQLQAINHQVAMVGDGMNDAPALAQANVGIALNSGTDIATETAGIILIRDRLSDLVNAIHLSQATFAKIRQNLFWAFAYNVLGIPLAAGALLPGFGILLNPAAAGALMAFSSVSVVTNSLLLYLTAPKKTA